MARPLNPANFHGDTAATMTAAGTVTGTAATVTADHVIVDVSTTTNNGVILRMLNGGEMGSIANANSADAVNVYPPSGCKLNGKTADLPFVLPAGKAMLYIAINATNLIAIGG